MQFDAIVSSWLSGEDSADGYANPAGPIYIHGAEATETALTSEDNAKNLISRGTTCSTCSMYLGGGCSCC